MNIFELFGRIAVDNKDALSKISATSKAATEIGKAFGKAQAVTGKSLAQIASENGKTVNQIRSEVAKAAAEYRKQGMNASEAMKKAYADIGYSAEKAHKEVNEEVEKTGGKYSDLASKVGKAFDKVGKFAVNCGKVMAKGLAVGTAAMTGLVVKGMGLAGDLEQNMGGAEAVFKQFADGMKKTASEAYKSMGLSQSDYLATANKMGALFQGVGYTIEDSASITEKAMQRAADVASIMGIDVSTAMESIAGAAKGNFTMMDNLGVAVNDTALANYALEKGITKSVAKMSTQEKVGLAMELFMEKTAYAAGNYAKENDTLAGSLTTLKAAFKNFLSGANVTDAQKYASGPNANSKFLKANAKEANASAKALASSLVSTGKVITKNLKNLLPHLVDGINELLVSLTPELPGLLESFLPGVIDGAGKLLVGLAKALPTLAKVVVDKLPEILRNLRTAAETAVPEIVNGIIGFFRSLPEKLPGIIKEAGDLMESIWSTGVWPMIQETFKVVFGIELPVWSYVKDDLVRKWEESGISEWAEGAFGNIKLFVEDIGTALGDLMEWATGDSAPLVGAIVGIAAAIAMLVNPGLAVAAVAALLVTNWGAVKEGVSSAFDTTVSWLEDNLGTPMENFRTNVIDPLIKRWGEVKEAIRLSAEKVGDFLGIDLVEGWDNITNKISSAWQTVASWISAASEAVSNFLGLDGTKGIGGGDARPWYVREHADDYDGHGKESTFNFSSTRFAPAYVRNHPELYNVNDNATGAVFKKATIFDTRLGLQRVGEAGPEAVAPIGVLQGYVKKAVQSETATLAAEMRYMVETFTETVANLRQQPIAVNIDSKAAAVLMAREMTKSIGNRNIQSLMGMGG